MQRNHGSHISARRCLQLGAWSATLYVLLAGLFVWGRVSPLMAQATRVVLATTHQATLDTTAQSHLCDSTDSNRCVVTGRVLKLGVEIQDAIKGSQVCVKGTSNCVISGDNGRFLLRHLPPAPFVLTAQLTGYITDEEPVEQIYSDSTINNQFVYMRLAIKLSKEEEERLRRDTLDSKHLLELFGRVVDEADTAMAIKGAEVCDVATSRCALSAEDGEYRLWVASGACRVTAEAAGYVLKQKDFACGHGKGELMIALKKSH
jgi:hypothetical protein